MRSALARSLRASDVMRLYGKVKPGKSRKGSGQRVVIVEKDVSLHNDSVRVWFRGIAGSPKMRRISDNVEGFTDLAPRILHPIEGVWEGELVPGSPGRIVEYNNRRYEPPMGNSPDDGVEGSTKVPAAKSKTRKSGSKSAAKKSGSNGGTRASEAELDRDAAKVVKLRDTQGKSWGDIEEATGIASSRLRQLYNRGGGEPTRQKAAGTKKGAAAKKGGARSKTKGRKRPS